MRRGFSRKKAVRSPKTRILIVCGGQATEVNYFKSFPVDTQVRQIDIKACAKDPYKIVQQVVKLRHRAEKEGAPYNQVWCVFDKDDFTDENFNSAVHMAEEERLRVAWSNQAFELWYCLHFDYIDGALHRSQYAAQLAGRFGSYRKNDRAMYGKLISRQEDALRNARKVRALKAALPPAKQDPVTLVYTLVETLNKFI